jgi:hypothetical protein
LTRAFSSRSDEPSLEGFFNERLQSVANSGGVPDAAGGRLFMLRVVRVQKLLHAVQQLPPGVGTFSGVSAARPLVRTGRLLRRRRHLRTQLL